MPTFKQTMAELKKLGTAQNRKIYARHGVGESMFGVSYANLKALTKNIKLDHNLAVQLWESGNHDARILAMSIADPAQATSKLLEAWARDLDNYVVTDAFSAYVSKTDLAQSKAERWMKSKNEWIATSGWNLLGYLAMGDYGLPDKYFEPYLNTITSDIHQQKNRVRYAMNNALIQIGSRSKGMARKATSAANKIGYVEVDHGETSCKTPDAAGYIAKVRARKDSAA